MSTEVTPQTIEPPVPAPTEQQSAGQKVYLDQNFT